MLLKGVGRTRQISGEEPAPPCDLISKAQSLIQGQKRCCVCMDAVPCDWPLAREMGRGKRLWRLVANLVRLVMFLGLPGQQWTLGLRVHLSGCRQRTVGPVLCAAFVGASGVIAVTRNSAIISRIRLMSNQRKEFRIRRSQISPPSPACFPDFTCLILHQLSFSAQCFFQVLSTSRVCPGRSSSNQAFCGATEGFYLLEVEKKS